MMDNSQQDDMHIIVNFGRGDVYYYGGNDYVAWDNNQFFAAPGFIRRVYSAEVHPIRVDSRDLFLSAYHHNQLQRERSSSAPANRTAAG